MFDPQNDKIAVVIKEFTLKKNADMFLDRNSEPYIISMTIDDNDVESPSINFNTLPFPNVRKGDTISFDGDGLLIYGPENPGSFLAYSILFMEYDQDIRDFGSMMEAIINSEAVKFSAKALLKASPTLSTSVTILENLGNLIANKLKKNGDDKLFRRNGTLLRDVKPAYDILRSYKSNNQYIDLKTSIIPLSNSNLLGEQPKKLSLS